jgi:hypothetical protein
VLNDWNKKETLMGWMMVHNNVVLKGSSGKFQEVRVEYIKLGELSSWVILIQKQAIWVTHEGLCISKGKSGLGHETFKPIEEECK